MPRNNSKARREKRRIAARTRQLARSANRNGRLTNTGPLIVQRQQSISPERQLTHSHYAGHKDGCKLPPQVCYATMGGM